MLGAQYRSPHDEWRKLAAFLGVLGNGAGPSPDAGGCGLVDLIERPASSVLGVAYRSAREQSYAVLKDLDGRELAGFQRAFAQLDVRDAPFGRAPALVYRTARKARAYGRRGCRGER